MPGTPPTTELDATAVASQLRLSVTRLARLLRQTADNDLTPTQTSVLVTIFKHGPMTLGEVAEREQVASPTVTKVVNNLHERGLVSKTPDPKDRRFVVVALTPAGTAVLKRNRERKNAWLARRLRDLPPGDLQRLAAAAEVLDALANAEDQR